MTKLLASAVGVIVIAFAAGSAAHAQIIDRILAAVEGQLITLSDVRGVIRLGLEAAPATGDPIQHVLDKLIDRQLVLVEVQRYAPAEPKPEIIEGRLQEVRGRFADALAFETTLHQIGMAVDDVRRYIRDTLRIEEYLEQRFTASIQPSEDEIAAYHRLNPGHFMRDGVLLPFQAARDDARRRLIAERRATLVREWLAGLRRRANIVQLYYSQPQAPK